jgi:hypothetical protein
MVAGAGVSTIDKDLQGIPKFDQGNVEAWIKALRLALMAKRRNHLGLDPRPVRPWLAHQVGTVEQRRKFDSDQEKWLERKDTCICAINYAVAEDNVAVEVVDQYMTEKEMLADDDAEKETLASELVAKLKTRFQGEANDEISDWNSKFTSFAILPGEASSAGITRLNGVIQKLRKLGQPQTDAAKLTKLKEVLQIDSLDRLWVSIALLKDPTYDDITQICKRYDKAVGKPADRKVEDEVHMADEKAIVCSYPKCGKRGHTQAQCFKKKKDQRIAKMKRKDRSDSKSTQSGGGKKPRSDDRQRGAVHCFCCGDTDHKSFECPDRVLVPSDKSLKKKKQQNGRDWNKFVRETSDDDEANMFFDDDIEVEEIHAMEEADRVYLDSCASRRLFLLRDQSNLENFTHMTGFINLTKEDAKVQTQGTGSYKDWQDIRVCHEAVKDICSAGMLRAMGYGLTLLRVPKVVTLLDNKEVLVGQYAENGMPYVSLLDLLHLPDLSKCNHLPDEVLLSDDYSDDPLEMLHLRAGHVSKSKLLEAFRLRLVEGTGLQRQNLSKRNIRKAKGHHICDSCAKSKITRASFAEQPSEHLVALAFLAKVTCDISVYLNCPSRQGYVYVLVFTDVATKYFWRYPLKRRTGPEILRCVKHLVEVEFPRFPGQHRLQHYHADGGAELNDQKVKSYLLEKTGCRMTYTPTDTPELNAVSERKFRTLGEMTMAMLADSGLPKSYWWDAYDTACDITLMMPTRTHRGWMSPTECVPGGKTPNLARLRRWGCKCYVLIPKADRRKDWEDKAMVGHFIGYSKTKIGYKILLQDTEVTSVHVLFDESIPPRDEAYFKDLEQATVGVDPEAKYVEDFQYLVGQMYMDEGLLYKTTRVVARKGLIVGFRALITAGVQQIEDKTPIHVADVQELTEVTARQMAATSDGRDAGSTGAPEVPTDSPPVTEPLETPGVSTGSTPPQPLERGAGKRTSRRPDYLGMAPLGEIHRLEEDWVQACEAADSLWYTDDDIREPQTHAESLRCSEHKEWKAARKRERDSIFQKNVMRVVPTPPGVTPIKSKYVYKKKYDKRGRLKKYKARLVALGYGQVAGVNVWNTFAPVVKGITVRLLLALAFIFNMSIHQLDVSNAFLYADIEGDVYMTPPPDFDLPPGYCMKLDKSLYGLKSSPRSWWRTLDKFIKSLHFKACVLEPCLYYMMYKGERMYLTIYVDDIIILCKNIQYIEEIKLQFCQRFDMTDEGEMEHFLNVRVTRTSEYLLMDQSVYAASVIEKHSHLVGQKSRKSPLPVDTADLLRAAADKEITSEEQEQLDNFPFRNLLGAMLYLAMNTRPDIAYAVGVLARYGNRINPTVCNLMIYLLQYVRCTINRGIRFSGSMFDMHIFTDADWAGDQVTRKSTTGFVVFAAGGPISWQSKLQPTVSTSSMQSEYQALYAGMQEIVWLRGVMEEVGLPFCDPTPFFLDAQSAQDLATNPVYHKRSKHIEIKYHWVREHVDPDGLFKTAVLHHVTSENQSADIYTKALTGQLLQAHSKRNVGEITLESEQVIQANSKRRLGSA